MDDSDYRALYQQASRYRRLGEESVGWTSDPAGIRFICQAGSIAAGAINEKLSDGTVIQLFGKPGTRRCDAAHANAQDHPGPPSGEAGGTKLVGGLLACVRPIRDSSGPIKEILLDRLCQ